jgi:hypothetical protein
MRFLKLMKSEAMTMDVEMPLTGVADEVGSAL